MGVTYLDRLRARADGPATLPELGLQGRPVPAERQVWGWITGKKRQFAPRIAYPTRPTAFIRDVLGEALWEKQEDIAEAVWDHRYVAVASCHGIGKSFLAARLIIAWLHCHGEGAVALSTAPTGRQVQHVLWREVNQAGQRNKDKLLGRILQTQWDIAPDWFAMGFKPNDKVTDPVQGFHADKILIVIDESAGVNPVIIDGFRAAMTTEGSRMLLIGNPTSTQGPFFDAFHRSRERWKKFKIAWTDTPNYLAGTTVMPKLITQQWVDDAIAEYGIDSAYVQSRVFANFVSAEDVLIPLTEILVASERGLDDVVVGPPYDAGLDVARYGDDKTALTTRSGQWCHGTVEWADAPTTETVARTMRHIEEHFPQCQNIKVDAVGVGAGVADQLAQELRRKGSPINVVPVNVARKSTDPEQWLNLRNELWWTVAQRFRHGEVGGILTDGLIAELSDVRYRYDTRHTKPVIESKEEMKKRIGHSPDRADSFVLAFTTPPPETDKVGYVAATGATVKWGRVR